MEDARAIYEQTLETLFKRVLDGRMTPKLQSELKKAGLDVHNPLPPQYAHAKWKKAFDAIARELFPGVPTHDAHVQLGRVLVEEYRRTGFGIALTALARMLGPSRVLLRAQEMISGGGRAARTELAEKGTGHYELWMKQAAVSVGFTEGLLFAGLSAAGAADVRVSHVSGSAKSGHTFALQWRPRN